MFCGVVIAVLCCGDMSLYWLWLCCESAVVLWLTLIDMIMHNEFIERNVINATC